MAKRRRSMHGLGDSPKGHADKAFNLANSAIRAFKQAVQPGKSCKAAFALYTNGAITMGEANGHHVEAHGLVSKAGDRRIELEKASEAAYGAIRGCLSSGSLSGLKSRRSALGASPLPKAEGIDKRGKRVKLAVKKHEGEWQVRVYEDGKFKDGPTYYAGGRPEDKQDAIETFHSMKASYGLAGMRRRKSRK